MAYKSQNFLGIGSGEINGEIPYKAWRNGAIYRAILIIRKVVYRIC